MPPELVDSMNSATPKVEESATHRGRRRSEFRVVAKSSGPVQPCGASMRRPMPLREDPASPSRRVNARRLSDIQGTHHETHDFA